MNNLFFLQTYTTTGIPTVMKKLMEIVSIFCNVAILVVTFRIIAHEKVHCSNTPLPWPGAPLGNRRSDVQLGHACEQRTRLITTFSFLTGWTHVELLPYGTRLRLEPVVGHGTLGLET